MGSLSTNAGTVNPNSFYVGSEGISGEFVTKWVPLAGQPDHADSGHIHKIYGADLEIFQGRILPDFHKRKNAGELLPYTAYYKLSTSMESEGHLNWSSANWYNYRTGPGPWLQLDGGHIYGGLNFFDQIAQELGVNPLYWVQAAASKIYSQGWDALTFVAELHKTVRMFRDAITSFGKLLEALRTEMTQLEPWMWAAPASSWLEGRYGWRILMYDIQDINNLINHLGTTQTFRTKERVGHTFSLTTNDTLTGNWSWAEVGASLTRSITLGVRGSMITDFVPSLYTTNLLATGWELTKFSFVVDWFFNIGQAINALSMIAFNHPYTAAHGLSLDYTRVVDDSWYNLITGKGVTAMDYHQASTWRTVGFRRVPCTVPLLPQINVNVNAFKVMDLVALLMQSVSKLMLR